MIGREEERLKVDFNGEERPVALLGVKGKAQQR